VINWKVLDGPGGTLAYASTDFSDCANGCSIQLDKSERWTIKDQDYSVRSVVTHELGHLFGLVHTNDQHSIMYPFYRPHVLVPAASDIKHIADRIKDSGKGSHLSAEKKVQLTLLENLFSGGAISKDNYQKFRTQIIST